MTEEAFPLGAIPERLKCAICISLARDAWKLSCCDSIVCGSCFDALPEDACPVCAFSPMDKAKSNISTSLRTTITVFLRHAEKRHKDALAKEAKEKAEASSNLMPPAYETDTTSSVEVAGRTLLDGSAASNEGTVNQAALQQQQLEYEKLYGVNAMAMNMNFPMMNGYPMNSMDPLMLQQMTMMGIPGFLGNGGYWNGNVSQDFLQQSINLQAQESILPAENVSFQGPQTSENSLRGTYQGRYAPRGHTNIRPGGRGAHHAPSTPVIVEGAPTGPSAMRNGVDRGRSSRNRTTVQRESLTHPDFGRDAHALSPQEHYSNEPDRGRKNGSSASRERSRSGPRRLSESRSSRSPRRQTHRSRSRSQSISQNIRRNSESPARSRQGVPLQKRHRSDRRRRSHSPKARSPTVDDKGSHSEGREKIVSVKSLADRIDKEPKARRHSRSRERHNGDRSSRRSRRRRSKSRSRSRDREKRRDARREVRPSERDGERPRKHSKQDSGKDHDRGGEGGGRRRSRERSSRKSASRRGKHEIGSPELRRLEAERDHGRYR